MPKMSIIDWIALILVIIGGLNWGLVGFFDYNLVTTIFKVDSTITKIVYDLVGVAALWMIIKSFMKSGASAAPKTM